MPAHFKDLIEKINESDEISCVIADLTVWWALEVAEKMGIKRAAFSPLGAGYLAFVLHIPKFIEDGIIDAEGTLIENNLIWLSKEIPAWSSTEIAWSVPGDSKTQNCLFELLFNMSHYVKLCNWLLCNSFYELDSIRLHAGSFWTEDSTCLSWLDKQSVGSVIYVAFGSTSIHSKQQFEELALGLELIGQPFLWVVRSDIIDEPLVEFLDGFKTRINDRGMIVQWAPQEKVLAHPSTVGLGLNPDENGLITRHEINTKIKTLLCDDGIKTNALKLKEMAKKSVN
uniref:UDP-glycosyltransferases domain-containing protein n=1 Tax=Fagus sylvatica TaxID=28930 RepID=A0A2N9HAR2_FAGSY